MHPRPPMLRLDDDAILALVDSLPAWQLFDLVRQHGISQSHRQAQILFTSGSIDRARTLFHRTLGQCDARLQPFVLMDMAARLRVARHPADARQAARDAVARVNGLILTDVWLQVLADDRDLQAMGDVMVDPRMAQLPQIARLVLWVIYLRAIGDRQRYERALHDLVALAPTDPVARMVLARHQALDSRLDQAAVHATFVIDRDPDHAEALAILALHSAQGGDRVEARRLMDRALALEPANGVVQALAANLTPRGQMRARRVELHDPAGQISTVSLLLAVIAGLVVVRVLAAAGPLALLGGLVLAAAVGVALHLRRRRRRRR